MKKGRLISLGCSLLLLTTVVGAEGFVKDLKNAELIDAGRASFTSKSAEPEQDVTTVEDLLHQWKDDEIFIDIAGRDKVKWKLIREQLEDQLSTFTARAEIGSEGLREAKKMAFRIRLQKLLKSYFRYAVIAQEAIRLKLKVSASEFEEQRRQARDMYMRRGKAGAPMLKRLDQKESLYEHNLTNALLWQAYAEKVLRPQNPVPDGDVRARVLEQHRANLVAVASNDYKRVWIQEIQKKVKGGLFGIGKMDFSEAASKWSDCNTSETGGVFMDENEAPQHIKSGDLCQELETAYKKLNAGEVSDVVETPHSWHVLKLLARHPAQGDEPESVELAHIMLEKTLLIPELTDEQARQKLSNAKVRLALNQKFAELLPKTKIMCKIPLFSGKGPQGNGIQGEDKPKKKGPLRVFKKMK